MNTGSGGALDFLKLRVSYSELGDDTAEGLDGFDYLTGYDLVTNDNGVAQPYILDDNQAVPTIRTRGLVNPFLTWEEMTVYNIGLEAILWNGKLSLGNRIVLQKARRNY